jgi:hypothetical protein
MRVSRSGGCTSVIRPHSKRLRSRSSSAGRGASARRSEVITICLLCVVQRVEGVEELFLRLCFALQELDVVDQQDVDVAVARWKRRLRLLAIALMKSLVNSSLDTYRTFTPV